MKKQTKYLGKKNKLENFLFSQVLIYNKGMVVMEIDAGPGAYIFFHADDVVRSFNYWDINSLLVFIK
jgi:hypothetical protein